MTTDQTAYVEVLARLLCAADVHVYGDAHPTWQQLGAEPGRRVQDDYRKAARWLAARLTVTSQPAAPSPAVSSAGQAPATEQTAAYRLAADEIRATIAPADWPSDAVSIWNTVTNIVEHRLRRAADEAAVPGRTTDETPGEAREWCKCPSCWGWFVQDHPGDDLDELGKDSSWWSGLPKHRDAPAVGGAQQPKEDRTVLPCNWARTRTEHLPHGWEPQPGMDPVHCPGFTQEAGRG
ncbi:hypothetical protein ACIBBD_02190 [Streptomyces sp. NPDC051315]|uniref:hypothetical protein n=1 Tax=Streptomyces sp. NPDC051315 TaxID=3365650 RepID=UPI0037BA2D01